MQSLHIFLGASGCSIAQWGRALGQIQSEHSLCVDADDRFLGKWGGSFLFRDDSGSARGCGARIDKGYGLFPQIKEPIWDLARHAHGTRIYTGLGGGTGTSGVVFLAELFRSQNHPFEVICTMPFAWEFPIRHRNAYWALGHLQKMGANVVCVRSDDLRIPSSTKVQDAFELLARECWNQSRQLTNQLT